MDSLVILIIADWPEKIGTSWYAIGGALGILVVVLIALTVLAHIRIPDPDRDAENDG